MSTSLSPEVVRLLERSWELRALAESQGCAVKGSIPVAWFGDLPAFKRSAVKVVTAAINPSSAEFPVADPLKRFPAARAGAKEAAIHAAALNAYFKEDPYRAWFDRLEPLLAGFGTSFYAGRQPSLALHTDLCSPVATEPKWAKLKCRAKLRADGVPHWLELLEILKPDVLLISVALDCLEQVPFLRGRSWSWSNSLIGSKAVWSTEAQVGGRSTKVAYGLSTQRGPFGALDADEMRAVGRCLGLGVQDGPGRSPHVGPSPPPPGSTTPPPATEPSATPAMGTAETPAGAMAKVLKADAIGRAEFEARLRAWAANSEAGGLVGGAQGYGGTPWIWVSDLGRLYHLNADATREGVTQYLSLLDQQGASLVWHVTRTSRSGALTKVVFGYRLSRVTRFPLYLDA